MSSLTRSGARSSSSASSSRGAGRPRRGPGAGRPLLGGARVVAPGGGGGGGLARGFARLDVLGQAGLVVLGQQLVPADVFQVQPDEIFIVPFGAVTYSSHGAFPRVGLRSPRGERRPSTIERRGMRPCSG